MVIEFIGADHEVTGSCHYMNVNGKHLLVDYGMEQGRNIYENAELPVPPSKIDFLVFTHAHIDHTGLLPLLYKNGFRGRVITTPATRQLCQIMLIDTANIQLQEAEWKNRKAQRAGAPPVEPLYTMDDAVNCLNLIESADYEEKKKLDEGITMRFTDVGHLLGSASVEFWLEENGVSKKIVFSGDIGNTGKPLIRDPEYVTSADYVVMESTYGNRLHDKEKTDHAKELAGKAAVFKTVLHEIQTREVPELNDAFADDKGFDTVDAYREDVRTRLTDAKAKAAAAANENAVIGKVVENAQIELPEPMIETQVEQLIDDYARRMQSQGLQLDQYMEYTGMTMDKLKEQFHPQAERNLKTRLTLEAVVEAENIQVSEEAIEDEIKRMADQYKIDVEKMHEFLSDDDKKNISMDLKIQEAVDFLVAEAKLV